MKFWGMIDVLRKWWASGDGLVLRLGLGSIDDIMLGAKYTRYPNLRIPIY